MTGKHPPPPQADTSGHLDDILLASPDRLNALVDDLVRAGSVVSPKSSTVPSMSVVWLGKEIDGADYSMCQAPTYVAGMMACCGCTNNKLRSLVGKIIWASSIGEGVAAFPPRTNCLDRMGASILPAHTPEGPVLPL